jgi:hypothetical protein
MLGLLPWGCFCGEASRSGDYDDHNGDHKSTNISRESMSCNQHNNHNNSHSVEDHLLTQWPLLVAIILLSNMN